MKKDDIIILDEGADLNTSTDVDICLNGDGSTTITLLYPITCALRSGNGSPREEVIREITIRRPNGGDLRDISKIKDPIEQGVRTFVLLSGYPAIVFDKMDLDDINRVSGVIESFLDKSPSTGKTSSLP